MNPRIRRFASQADMTQAALTLVSQAASRAVAERGRCLIALAGGSTPLPLYAAMARQGLGTPWEAIHFFFGDERLVPVGDRRSNFGAVAPLLFTRAPIPMDNIHPMPVDVQPPERAATVYEEELRDVFGVAPGELPRFDCLLLGLGPDGHMASLFPGSPALAPTDRLVAAVPPPTTVEPHSPGLTLTVPVIKRCPGKFLFLVALPGQGNRLSAAVLAGTPDPALQRACRAPRRRRLAHPGRLRPETSALSQGTAAEAASGQRALPFAIPCCFSPVARTGSDTRQVAGHVWQVPGRRSGGNRSPNRR